MLISFSDILENIVEKEKMLVAGRYKLGLCSKELKTLLQNDKYDIMGSFFLLTLYHTISTFNDREEGAF